MSTAERYAAILAELSAVGVSATDAERIESLTLLERIKSAAAAAQGRDTDGFAVSQRATLLEAGSKPADAARSITGQVALARRDSPSRATGTSGWPRCWSGRCLGSLTSWAAVTPVSGAARSSPGRPRT